jgi:hypothetical protein
MESTKTANSKNLTPVRDPNLFGGFRSGGDLIYREELKEVRAEAMGRRLDKPIEYASSFWYKINPYTKRKQFIMPSQESLPDHLKELILKKLLASEKKLLSDRKRKLKVIKKMGPGIKWFFEELEAAEFAEYYVIQKWIGNLFYGHLREGEEFTD